MTREIVDTHHELEGQRMLVPMVIELPAAEGDAPVSRGEALARFGSEVEEFGGDSIKVTSMPACCPR